MLRTTLKFVARKARTDRRRLVVATSLSSQPLSAAAQFAFCLPIRHPRIGYLPQSVRRNAVQSRRAGLHSSGASKTPGIISPRFSTCDNTFR